MSGKTIIVYKSSTGFTRRYAQMIAEKTGAQLLDLKETKAIKLRGADTIVFGGRLRAGSIDGLKKARALYEKSGASRFVVFATGAAPNEARETIEETWRKNLNPSELETVPHFYMQAGLCYEKMGFVDRSMMKMLGRMLAARKNKTPQDEALEKMLEKSFDISDESFILPLLEYLK